MEVIDERVAQRRSNFEFYERELSAIEGITFQPEAEGSFSNRWLSCLVMDTEKIGGVTREDIRLKLATQNIEARPLWKPMHLQPVFAGTSYYGGDVAEKLFRDGLCLPSGSNLTKEELGRVVTAIKSCF
jgi:dTDP-4-amino-4,6-dideoxygalactose transaminase